MNALRSGMVVMGARMRAAPTGTTVAAVFCGARLSGGRGQHGQSHRLQLSPASRASAKQASA